MMKAYICSQRDQKLKLGQKRKRVEDEKGSLEVGSLQTGEKIKWITLESNSTAMVRTNEWFRV